VHVFLVCLVKKRIYAYCDVIVFLVINLKQQKPAIVPVRTASAVLKLSPIFYTVIDVADYKTIFIYYFLYNYAPQP